MSNMFKQFITDNTLIKPDDRILLTVSGGIDSMVMTHLFLQMKNEIGIAHCNFSLRASESDKDEEMVCKYAADNNIPFYSTRFETKTIAKKRNLSIQMAARELRYSWFEKIRNENNYDIIAVAHNLNDNIETLIINLTRGTGIAGLTGMKPVNNRIIRPLLYASRQIITEYARQNQISFREDKSNAETKYTRNKIRHLVIPVLKEINPSIESTLNDTTERFTGINEIVSDYISGLREKVSGHRSKLTVFNINLLTDYMHNNTILYELFKPYNITTAMLKDLKILIEGKTGNQIITNSHRIIKNRSEVLVSPENNEDETFYSIKTIQELLQVPIIKSARYISITDSFTINKDPSTASIDSEKLSFPFIIRKWEAGDYFFPLGMQNKKKLSDYFIDNKYSIVDKENQYILESNGKIVWIIGDRIDNRFKISESTNKALIINSLL